MVLVNRHFSVPAMRATPEYSLAPAKREISKIRESILFHVPISAINSRRGRSLGRDPRRAPANTAVIDSYVRRDAASLVPQSTYNQESEAGRDTPPGSIKNKLPASRCAR